MVLYTIKKLIILQGSSNFSVPGTCSWKIIFPGIDEGKGWFLEDSSTLYLLCLFRVEKVGCVCDAFHPRQLNGKSEGRVCVCGDEPPFH